MSEIRSQESEVRERLQKILSPARYRHSLATQNVAIELARYYGFNVTKASLTGLLHDCGKGYSNSEAEAYIKNYKLNLDVIEREEPELWHGPIGAQMARCEFGIRDPEVLRAIRLHSTASSRMSATAKIIYVADYIEPNRHFKGRDQIHRMAFKDLDLATFYVLNHKLSYILHKRVLVHPASIKARNSLFKRICCLQES